MGFRTRISGESDFPCIYDNQVGQARSYAKVEGPLTYNSWLNSLRDGRSYVSDGASHLIDFTVNGVAVGSQDSEVRLNAEGDVHVEVKVAARLDPVPDSELKKRRYDEKPYWHIERARVEGRREVPVELVVNGQVVAQKKVVADGRLRKITFDVPIDQSSWIAVRILPSSHTNPVFAVVGGKPIRASAQSAEWCLNAVNQCWTQKASKISAQELRGARHAYDHARQVYERLIRESSRP